MSAAVILSHASSLEHDPGPHPERPERLHAIERALASAPGLAFERREAVPVTREALLAVHSQRHVDAVERLVRRGGGALDGDTVASPGTWDAALHAAGAAVGGADLAIARPGTHAICLTRPPGHHADAGRAMGFCFFNNVAVAAAHAVREYGLRRVLIVDWDVHHGNGTNDIFHASSEVLYASIHQAPLYPGTGPAGDRGSGEGLGYTLNVPVAAGSDDAVFAGFVEDVVAPLALSWRAQLLLVSAGFDAHRDDPLADCCVSEDGFRRMTAAMAGAAERLGAGLCLVLEGGYDTAALGRCVVACVGALGAGSQ